ncbi:calcium-activated chloride channel domain-containing protein [Ditylenchus destructor]|nr:calcium-activated chloride channel domain-containing protein [Ditylenchus destructor]
MRSRSRSDVPKDMIRLRFQNQPEIFVYDELTESKEENSEYQNPLGDSMLPTPEPDQNRPPFATVTSNLSIGGSRNEANIVDWLVNSLWSMLQVSKTMLQRRLGDIIQEGINEGQRFALSSDLWRWASPTESRCDILLTIKCDPNHQFAKQVVVWLIDTFKRYAPQLKVAIRFHKLTNSYALYLSASYLSLLKGAELCHLKKRVRANSNYFYTKKLPRNAGGGMLYDFCIEQAHSFTNIENKAEFLEGWERSLVLKQMVDMIRAPKGGFKFRYEAQTQHDKHRELGEQLNFHIPEGRAVVSALRSLDVIEYVLPLHETHKLKWLQQHWVFAFFEPQPLDEIKAYFGPEISLYFAWLGHLTTALWAPAILGFFMFFFSGFSLNKASHLRDGKQPDSLFSDICFVVFALFNCVWSTAYLELWKRRQAELSFKWGTYQHQKEPLIDDPRPAFKGDGVAPNPVTGRLEPTYPAWKNALIRYGITYPTTFLCICLVFLTLFCMLRLQDIADSYFKLSPFYLRWLVYVPMIIQALIIMAGDNLYRHLALFFNDLENYRTDEEFENFLISKIVLFQCVSAFGSLFYIAFYLNDMRRLQETLATLLITRQLTQNLQEIAMPFLMEKLRLCRLTYKMTRTLSDRALRRRVEAIRKRRDTPSDMENLLPVPDSNEEHENPTQDTSHENTCSLGRNPNRWSSVRLRRTNVSATSLKLLNELAQNPPRSPQNENPEKRLLNRMESIRLPVPEFCPSSNDDFELTEAELQSLMTAYTRPLDDYLEMFIQFGYVLLFSPAFPLAAFCALINNLFEIRIDAFKLCNAVQRPFARRVNTIGAWQRAMELMGIAGVIVNCALIGQSGLIERICPDISLGGQILLVVMLEHIIFGAKMAVDAAIPNVPHWIQVETARAEHWRWEAFKVSTILISPSRNKPKLYDKTQTYSQIMGETMFVVYR